METATPDGSRRWGLREPTTLARFADRRHLRLADATARQGPTSEAVEKRRKALQLNSNSLSALNDAAWLLAAREGSATGDAQEAVELAERACELIGRTQAGALDTLAAAYAAAVGFGDAVQTARKAIDLALASKQDGLAAEIRARLLLYKAGRPYRAQTSTSTASAPSSR